jgi:signal transduction histidine kinase
VLLGDVLRQAIDSLENQAVQRGLQLSLEIASDVPPVLGVASEFKSVWTNLISNALAAMPDEGTLTIETSGDEEQVCFKVQDTGIGIAKENMSRIFTPFFTTKKMGKGTGLGLAVTYGIVKMHRGDIRVKSNADPAAGPTGTTFTVTIPRQGRPE